MCRKQNQTSQKNMLIIPKLNHVRSRYYENQIVQKNNKEISTTSLGRKYITSLNVYPKDDKQHNENEMVAKRSPITVFYIKTVANGNHNE